MSTTERAPEQNRGRTSLSPDQRKQHAVDVVTDLLSTLEPITLEQPPTELDHAIAQLPDSARTKLLARIPDLERDIPDPKSREKVLLLMAQDMLDTYRDVRFTFGEEMMWKEDYGRIQMTRWGVELLEEDPRIETLDRLAWVSFDANGLKAINDLSGSHENGTRYLRLLARVFHDPTTHAELYNRFGISHCVAVSGGGDEFSLVLRGENALTPDILEKITLLFEENIRLLDTEVGDLIDFSKHATKLRYLGFDESLLYDDLTAKQKEEYDAIPPGFRMEASGQGGWATLRQGIDISADAGVDSKRISPGDTLRDIVRKAMGGAISLSDSMATQRKQLFKKSLLEKDPATDRPVPEKEFYRHVLSRTTEVRMFEKLIDDIREAVTEYEGDGQTDGSCHKGMGKIRQAVASKK